MSLNLQVFNRELTRLGVVDVVTGLTWSEKFADVGEFELWCPVTDTNIQLLKEDNLLWIGTDSAGVIEFKELTIDDDGTYTMHIRGRLCECYLDFRTVYPRFSMSGKVSKIMQALVTRNIISPSDSKRKIPNVQLDSSQQDLGNSISFQKLGDTVLKSCTDLGEANGLGFRLKFVPSQKAFLFQVYVGTNRTMDQSAVTPVLFSSELDDILESSYSHNKSELRTDSYIAGEGEGTARIMTSTGSSAAGLDRRELFVDAGDLQSIAEDGNTIPANQYKAMLVERGKSKLEENKDIETFSATLRTFGVMSYIYGQHYFLGDAVTVYDSRLKLQTNAIVTAIERTFNEDGETLDVTFGYGQPTLVTKLRRVM